jgi:two-component sensor histidine kinase
VTAEQSAAGGLPGAGGGGLSVQLDAAPTAGGEARRALDALRDELTPTTLADLRAVVTELVANSVRFGSGDAIEVRVVAGPRGSVRGRVGDGSDPRRRIRAARHDAAGGIGLRVVAGLANNVRVQPDGVWFELAPNSS